MSGTHQVLDAAETAAALPYPELAAAIGSTLADNRSGTVKAIERSSATLQNGGTFLLMGAADSDLAVAKIVAVHGTNAAIGLPTILASLIITSAETGELVGIADGATVTVRRTAALSLFAAGQVGARSDTTLVVGAGAQARGHVDAFHAGQGIRRLYVASRSAGRAEELALHARSLGIEASLVRGEDALLAAAAASDLVLTTTNSTTPVLPATIADALQPHATVVAVGAFRPDMAELPAEMLGAVDVIVDTLAGAEEEAGGLIQAAAAGKWSWSAARELADTLTGYERGERPVLVKTVGHSMWDLAAARLLARQLRERA